MVPGHEWYGRCGLEGSPSIVAMTRDGPVRARHGSFTRGADVFRACALEDLLRALRLVGVLRMDGDQHVATLDLALVLLGLVLGDAESDQAPRDPADGRTDRCAAERSHDRPRGDERAESRDGQEADACEPTQCASHESARAGARGRAFRRLGAVRDGEIARAALVRHQYRDVIAGEACAPELIDETCRAGAILHDAKDCSSHGVTFLA